MLLSYGQLSYKKSLYASCLRGERLKKVDDKIKKCDVREAKSCARGSEPYDFFKESPLCGLIFHRHFFVVSEIRG